jgi:hypothetical protein
MNMYLKRDCQIENVLKTLCHEYRHAIQCDTGLLTWSGTELQWNKRISTSQEPWEIDANQHAEVMVKYLLQRLGF